MLIWSRAPLRISFCGGGTDVSPYMEERGGVVLSATINRYASARLRPRHRPGITVRSHDYDTVVRYPANGDLHDDGQLDLVKAVLRHYRTVSELRGMVEEKVDLFLARRQRRFVAGQLARARRTLRRAEERLARFQERARIVSLPDETKAAIENLAELEKERTLARVAALDAASRLATVRRQVEAQTAEPVEDLPAHSPLVRELREQLVDLNAQLAVARVEFTEEHPTVRQLRTQAAEIERQIAVEARRIRRSTTLTIAPELTQLEVERIARDASAAALGQAIGTLRQRFERLPGEGLQLARLTRDRTVAEGLYTLLAGEHERARLMEAREGPGFIVLDRAIVPERHVFPRTLFNVLIAGVLSLWLGITLALLMERAAAPEHGSGSANGTGPEPHGATPYDEEPQAVERV